jgi:hypothetical protein
MSEIERVSMPMRRLALLDRIAIASPFKLILTLSKKNDTTIESRRTCGNARIPTAGDQVRKVLHDFIPSLLAALLQCSSCVGAVATGGRISSIFGSFSDLAVQLLGEARPSPA